MYPPKFDYYRASTVDEALSLMQTHQGKFLAGGHSLIPVMNLRLADPGTVIDIGRIEALKGISVNGDTVWIGALTTHAMIAASSAVPKVLSEAAGMIGDPQVRNRGTVGGNISHADPASDLPTVFSALNATMHIQGAGGSRSVSADDFFVDLFMTALGEDELLVAVEVPAASAAGSANVQ
jgi:carbon-monoxide dehydrogenase medium subunit